MNRFKHVVGSLKRNNLFKYVVFKLFHPKLVLSAEDKEPYVVHLKKNPAFAHYVAREFDEDINEQLNQYGAMEELEYLLKFNKKCFIEPRYGWIISDGKIAFRRSLPYSITERTPLPHYIYYKKKKKISLKEGLPLFYNWFNYWHFYNDIIGSLMVLDKLDFDKSIPLIVPEKALQVSYVKDFFSTDYAKKWNWLFVDQSTYVYLNKAFVVKSFANVKEQFLLAKEIFKTASQESGNRRIFIDRVNAANGRTILNKHQLIPIIRKCGYEIVNTDGMSVWEQKILFESSEVILGIHGAGLTNMFFRYPGKCKILELFPKGYYPIHYYWLAKELSFEYDAFAGTDNQNGSFSVDLDKLSLFLEKHQFLKREIKKKQF